MNTIRARMTSIEGNVFDVTQEIFEMFDNAENMLEVNQDPNQAIPEIPVEDKYAHNNVLEATMKTAEFIVKDTTFGITSGEMKQPDLQEVAKYFHAKFKGEPDDFWSKYEGIAYSLGFKHQVDIFESIKYLLDRFD